MHMTILKRHYLALPTFFSYFPRIDTIYSRSPPGEIVIALDFSIIVTLEVRWSYARVTLDTRNKQRENNCRNHGCTCVMLTSERWYSILSDCHKWMRWRFCKTSAYIVLYCVELLTDSSSVFHTRQISNLSNLDIIASISSQILFWNYIIQLYKSYDPDSGRQVLRVVKFRLSPFN